ncbi:MAG: FIST N-terminal domain-containing protein [Chitinophagaceae bacterium]
MRIEQKKFSKTHGWETLKVTSFDASKCNLVLASGSNSILEDAALYKTIRGNYPNADIIMNSTSGEIYDVQVNDDTVSLTAVCFDSTIIKTASVQIDEVKNSREAGRFLASSLDTENLKNVLIISDGQKVNGSELIQGLQEYLPKETLITGGLAGDGSRFKRTLVGLNEQPIEGRVVAIGFYGNSLSVSYGSAGGWDSFGPERLITKSDANILYELDGKPALDTYKMYLGEYANELPGSGLLFPLSIRLPDSEELVVRTILGVNEEEKSLTFAGNMPEGAYARLMKANFDRLIEGASNAAQNSIHGNIQSPKLAILISCVGRKLVLNQRIEEEVEVVRAMYGDDTAITGFYSYGEISPSSKFTKCELHNQTMTITTFSEQ